MFQHLGWFDDWIRTCDDLAIGASDLIILRSYLIRQTNVGIFKKLKWRSNDSVQFPQQFHADSYTSSFFFK